MIIGSPFSAQSLPLSENGNDVRGNSKRSDRFTVRRMVAASIVLAILLRLVSAIYQGNDVADLPGIYDQISYNALAQRVLQGHGFTFGTGWWPATDAGEPTAHWSFLYTLYLALVYMVFGVEPVVARLIQAFLAGILHTWLTWRIGCRVFGPGTGLIAAVLSSVYIYFVYYAGGLVTETFYIIGILWTLDVTFRLTDRKSTTRSAANSRWRWMELGLAIGTTVLLRQVFLLFVPFLFAWVLWETQWTQRRRPAPDQNMNMGRRPVFEGLIAGSLVVILMVAPWTIRNYRAFGTFVLLNTNAGFAFFWGNHPIHGASFLPLLPPDGPSYQDLIPEQLRHLNEGQLDKALLRKGLGFIVDDPTRFLRLSISRVREYFRFWVSENSSLLSNISRIGSFGICLPFMLYGLLVSARLIRNGGRPSRRSDILLLYLFISVYTAIHLMSWTLIRYRLPVDAILILFAALGIQQLATRFSCGNAERLNQNPS